MGKLKRITHKKMLLVSGALTTTSLLVIACGPTIVANPKGCNYDDGGYYDGITGKPCDLDASSDTQAEVSFGDYDAAKDAAGDATKDAASDATNDDASDALGDGD
jgi:hypothetical protein